jgi:hypothetical protein
LERQHGMHMWQHGVLNHVVEGKHRPFRQPFSPWIWLPYKR